MSQHNKVKDTLRAKFADPAIAEHDCPDLTPLTHLSSRGSCRAFKSDPIPRGTIDVLCATALAAPTKSDLQQRDIIVIEDPDLKADLIGLIAHQPWTRNIPHLLIFCGNNRRQRLLHEWHGLTFANDHLDAFFNATADAAIAMEAFIAAAEALGFGCCPISAIRDHAQKVSELLSLPDHVFPFAGLALGHPETAPQTNSLRLPLSVTLHTDRYQEEDLHGKVRAYDDQRQREQPYGQQRFAEVYGQNTRYGWSLDKARQYSFGERTTFGDFIRSKGFKL